MSVEQLSSLHSYDTGRASSSWRMHLEVARMAYEKGLYAVAVRNYRSALSTAQEMSVPEQDISAGLLGLAKCYCELRNFCQAETLYKRVLQIDTAALSAQRGAVVTDLNELASLYLKVGRLAEAESLLKQSTVILGSGKTEALTLATTEKNFGQLYCQYGRLAEAEHHLRQALAKCDTGPGRQTKLFAEVLIVLALVVTRKGCYQEAEALIERAIESFEVLTGGEHPELADFLDVAADLFQLENVPAKVGELVDRAKAIRKHIREIDH